MQYAKFRLLKKFQVANVKKNQNMSHVETVEKESQIKHLNDKIIW